MKRVREARAAIRNGDLARRVCNEPARAAGEHYYRRTTCRICKSPGPQTFIDFGLMPLANAFRATGESFTSDPRYPLSCAFCADCGLVQVPDVVDPDILFTRYSYFSSASEPMVEHFRRQAETLRQDYLGDPSSLICEIGSNDGIFLQCLVGKCRMVGVDPADNISPAAALKGVTTVGAFFNPQTASAIRGFFGPAKVIYTANCFAHVDDLDSIMDGILELLRDDGVFVFENHRFVHMLRTLCFDQIYHEHLSYYTLRPIDHLMKRFGMRVIDVRSIPTQGESFQIHCAKLGSAYAEKPGVGRARREESTLGLDDAGTYAQLAQAISRRQDDLKTLLADLKSKGKRIVGYGAPGKATTLLNAIGVDNDTIEYAIDSTPVKQGCFIPGTRIPIKPPQALETDSPDYLLLLAWNYADVILERERALRARGIKFIVPVPDLQIV